MKKTVLLALLFALFTLWPVDRSRRPDKPDDGTVSAGDPAVPALVITG